jgi:16S rRNA (adenine1518-N6/adenine1519-N6)-dimethyltransferase
MEHRPRKRYGQHFLHDRRVIERIVAAIDPQPGQPLVEIGPGLGALTAPLVERLGHLHVVEIDRDLIARLREAFPPDRLTIHAGDALEFDFAALPGPLRVVGNLPYNVSTPLLFHLAPCADHLRDGHFMLQREVVERMVARSATADYGRLSVMLQYRFDMAKLFLVASGAFSPPPKVDSAIVRITPKPVRALAGADEPRFAAIVTRAFSMRRKTLRNALAGWLAPAQLEQCGVDPGLRPEVLTVDDYVRLARVAGAHPNSGFPP